MEDEICESMFSMYFNYLKLADVGEEGTTDELLRYAAQFYKEFYVEALKTISKSKHNEIFTRS